MHETITIRLLALTAAFSMCAPGAVRAQTAQAAQVKIEAARPQAANIRIEVLLTDKAEGKIVTEERLTMLLADLAEGRLRRSLPARVEHANRELQVDLKANVVGDRIRLALTLQYNAPLSPNASGNEADSIGFIQMATSFLEPGKPTVMIDASGGPGNRRVAVQATATIVR